MGAFKLDIATFNGTREILVLTDYAAVYEMSSKHVGNSERDISCNQLVALVFHSPGPVATKAGDERSVVCDYWRVWSNKKGDANYHHSVMKQRAANYKQKNPSLRRMKLWTDGQRSQYTSRNFWVEWPTGMARWAFRSGTISLFRIMLL